ncbi:MAG: hypothetical protein QW416_00295 [Candidatus Nitrosocaldaceae archaeon]
MNRLIIIAPIIAITISIILITYNMQNNQNVIKTNLNETDVPDLFAEGRVNLEISSKIARYIVIGKIIDQSDYTYKVSDDIEEYQSGTGIEIEKELTGSYNGSRIYFSSVRTSWIKGGDRVLAFIADKEPHTVWGNNYYLLGGLYGLYKIVNDKVYGQDLRDGKPLNETIDAIYRAREDRLKYATLESKYIGIGRVVNITLKSVDAESKVYDITNLNITDLYLSEPHTNVYITLKVEKYLIGTYDKEEVKVVTDLRDFRIAGGGYIGGIGDRYLFFIVNDDDPFYDGYSYVGKELYHIKDGIVKGRELQEGMPIDEVEKRIIMFKNSQ